MSKVIDIKTRKPVKPGAVPDVQKCACGWRPPTITGVTASAPMTPDMVVNPVPGRSLNVSYLCPCCGSGFVWSFTPRT